MSKKGVIKNTFGGILFLVIDTHSICEQRKKFLLWVNSFFGELWINGCQNNSFYISSNAISNVASSTIRNFDLYEF